MKSRPTAGSDVVDDENRAALSHYRREVGRNGKVDSGWGVLSSSKRCKEDMK
jgi:hypothetical protein